MAVLYDGPDGPFRDVAETIASDRGDPIVDSVSALPSGPVLYVTDPMDVGEDVVLALQRRLEELGPEDGGFGIVTGATPSSALDLYDRGTENCETDRTEHGIFLRDATRDWFSYDDETTVLTGSDVSVEAYRSLLPDLESLSTLIHGRSIHHILADGYVCGFPERRTGTFDGGQPYCVSADGERDCPLDGELLPADELSVPHLFVDSCASMLPENDYEGLPVHVGVGLLEGATSVIGTYRQIDARQQVSLLHYCLLRAGYTTAERCYLLNRVAEAYRTSAYPYVAFGCPGTVASTSEPGSAPVADVDGRTVTFRDVDAHVVDVTLDLEIENDEWYVRNRTDELADAPIYAAAFQEGDDVRVLAFTWGRAELDELTLELDGSPVCERERQMVADAIENAETLETLNYLDSKAHGQLKDLGNRFDGLASDVYEQRFDSNRHRSVSEQMGRIRDSLDRIEDRVLDSLSDRYSNYLADDYREDFRRTAVTVTDDPCPNCDRVVFEKTMSNTAGTVVRRRGICPECGFIYDLPGDERSASKPRISGDLVPVTDDAVEVELSFENRRDLPMRTTFYPWLGVGNDEYRGAAVFDPASETTTLDPGERESVTFEIDVSQLENNEYYLCGYVLGNLRLYQGSRRMIVGPKFGHLRADRRAEPPDGSE